MRIIGMSRVFIQNHGNGIIGVSVLDHKIIKVIYFLVCGVIMGVWSIFWSIFCVIFLSFLSFYKLQEAQILKAFKFEFKIL
jgi:hypothetical protein